MERYAGERYPGERYGAQDEHAETMHRLPPARRWSKDISLQRLALAAGFLTCLVVLGVSIWSALGYHRAGTPPVIEAARGPLRVRPDNPGGMQMQGQNEDILSSDPSARVGQLAPAPEAPAPDILRARQRAAAAAAAAAAAPQPVALPPAQAAIAAPVTPLPPEKPVAASVVAPPLAPVARVVASANAPASAVPAGRVQAQLAAVGSEQAAKSEWQRLAKRMPDVLGGRQPVVVKADRDGHVVWRLRTGGFVDRAQANAFCAQVKAKGANCAVSLL